MEQANLKRILYVEDEPDIQMIVKIMLETAGFQISACDSGREALEKAASFQPDLVLMDVMMPEMDGPSTLVELRKDSRLTEIPVIFMTAKIQRPEIEHYKGLGAIEVIAKPFDPLTLPIKIRGIWEDYRKKGVAVS